MLSLPGYAADMRVMSDGQFITGLLKKMWLHELQAQNLAPDGITHGRAAFKCAGQKELRLELPLQENDAMYLLRLFLSHFLQTRMDFNSADPLCEKAAIINPVMMQRSYKVQLPKFIEEHGHEGHSFAEFWKREAKEVSSPAFMDGLNFLHGQVQKQRRRFRGTVNGEKDEVFITLYRVPEARKILESTVANTATKIVTDLVLEELYPEIERSKHDKRGRR